MKISANKFLDDCHPSTEWRGKKNLESEKPVDGSFFLFPQAEGGKNGAQHVLRIHGSGDFSQVRQGLSQFQGCEFRTFLAGDGFRSQPDMLPAEAQFMLVPGIDGYQGAARFTGQGGGKGLDNGFLQFLSSFPGGAGKPDAGQVFT